ncbi:MAG: EAL domain-containing protein [Planctomycetota bacterium]
MSELTPIPQPDSSTPASGRSWLAWVALAVVAVAAGALVLVATSLRDHADQRRNIMVELTALEVEATAQHTIVWRAITQLMADEKMPFIRTRGEEQIKRTEILARLDALRSMELACNPWDQRLGHEAKLDLMDGLDNATHRFLAGVQGAMGQMNLSHERMRSRLANWDMNFGGFEEALTALRERDGEIATAATQVANRVTAAAASITFLAAMLFVLALGRMRARRALEIQKEHTKTLRASEARFRELVQNSSDLIVVLEPSGQVRYATPSAKILGDAITQEASQSRTESAAEEALRAAEAIDRAIEAGAMESAHLAAEELHCTIDALMGLSAHELVQAENTEVRLKNEAGDVLVFDVHATDLSGHPDLAGIVLNARDVTEAKQLEDELRHQALHDPLTGLANRRQFSQLFDGLSPNARELASVLFVDLDGFKLVNDSYGHTVGDQLLIHTAARIKSCLGDRDLVARQGGDEFILLCSGTENDTDAHSPRERGAEIAQRIQKVLSAPFEIGRGIGPDTDTPAEIFVSASVGVVSNLEGIDAEQAAQRADIAMYKAKEAGKAQAIVFSHEMLEGAPERLALESDFRKALERDEFTVVYQPKVGLRSGKTESLEALVRWIHPERGFVGPDLFIPFAEESGLVSELGRVVLEKACMDAVRWQAHDVVVAVNLSPIQFRNPELVNEVRNALEMSGLDPKYLELEITESAVLGDVQNTIRVMDELKTLGIRLAIDDFGTGYSNLAHLKHFNVDVLKIDQAFVRGGSGGPMDHLSDGAIVEAVIGMAKAFRMHVVAEGVESEHHADELRELGADLGQGYFFSRPVGSDGIDDFLAGEIDSGVRTAPIGAVRPSP